ncbi:MAG: ATP-binding protein, partial [Cytophagales bacterium]|nr:ATP-binding protein [Cytophagales bacterium]
MNDRLLQKDNFPLFYLNTSDDTQNELEILMNEVLIDYLNQCQSNTVELKENSPHETSKDIFLNTFSSEDKSRAAILYDLSKKKLEAVIDAKELLRKEKHTALNEAKSKSDFLSLMSHEIRTPLNAIIGNIHLLKEGDYLPDQIESINTLQISSANLLSLINDILDLNKLSEGMIVLSKDKVKLERVLSNIVATNKFKASLAEIHLDMDYDSELPQTVITDEIRLTQILNNLVGNAIKFTEKGGHVMVSVHRVSPKNAPLMVRFSVTDTGIGLKEQEIEKIFGRFEQIKNDFTKHVHGTGLGLSIVKELLRIQGSKIKVASKYGEGSEFYFTLGLEEATTEDETLMEAKPRTLQDSLQGQNILLVDDVKFNLTVAEKMMSKWGVIVDTAENGLVALEKCKAKHFDLILMDIQMPVMNGFEATKQIR